MSFQSNDDLIKTRMLEKVSKVMDACGGEEKKYVGFVERPNMKEIVSEAMKEVYSKHSEKVVKKQIGGDHYQVAAIQPWDIMAAYGLDPWSANVVKYILRFPYKAGRQDLEKAQHYIEYLITHYDDVKDKYYD